MITSWASLDIAINKYPTRAKFFLSAGELEIGLENWSPGNRGPDARPCDVMTP